MAYVDGYVIPLPKKNRAAYVKMAKAAAKIFRKHGATGVRECIGDALAVPWGMPFPKQLKLKRGETVVFSWVEFKNKADRDRVNKKMMADPGMPMPKKMPFDMKRMVYGGFEVVVSA